jgi:tRNA-binding EMAP/Myf-like protein
MRPLAVIGQITETQAIPEADRIHSVTVDCGGEGTWRAVAPKAIQAGDPVVVFLQDALLPAEDPRFAFLKQQKFRIVMRRFKGAPSECLVLPNDSGISEVGADVTEYYRVLPGDQVRKAGSCVHGRGSHWRLPDQPLPDHG